MGAAVEKAGEVQIVSFTCHPEIVSK